MFSRIVTPIRVDWSAVTPPKEETEGIILMIGARESGFSDSAVLLSAIHRYLPEGISVLQLPNSTARMSLIHEDWSYVARKCSHIMQSGKDKHAERKETVIHYLSDEKIEILDRLYPQKHMVVMAMDIDHVPHYLRLGADLIFIRNTDSAFSTAQINKICNPMMTIVFPEESATVWRESSDNGDANAVQWIGMDQRNLETHWLSLVAGLADSKVEQKNNE